MHNKISLLLSSFPTPTIIFQGLSLHISVCLGEYVSKHKEFPQWPASSQLHFVPVSNGNHSLTQNYLKICFHKP